MGDIATRLDELLKVKGVSGYKMCSDLQMSRSFMTELRKGRSKGLSLETAGKIAAYLGVTVDYLTGRTDDPVPTKKDAPEGAPIKLSEIEFALFDEVRELDDEDKAELLKDAKRFRELKELRKKQQG